MNDSTSLRTSAAALAGESTPEELLELELGYHRVRQSLADELLAKVKASSPEWFESLVVDLIVRIGYGGSQDDAGKAIGKSGDGDADGIIKEDQLGLDVIYVNVHLCGVN